MATGDTTAGLVEAKVAVVISSSGTNSLEGKWTVEISQAVTEANEMINSALIARAYSVAQIATWAAKQEICTTIGMLLVIEKISMMRPGVEGPWVDRLWERMNKWLDRSGDGNIPLTAAGLAIDGASHDDNAPAESKRGPQTTNTREFGLQEDLVGFGPVRTSLGGKRTLNLDPKQDC